MRIASYHTHTTYCDGADSAETMILSAIKCGFTDVGFTTHTAWPFAAIWHCKPEKYKEYCNEIITLKKKYEDQINILLGFEADYIEGITKPDTSIYGHLSPDFLVGSVHYVRPYNSQAGELWEPDAPSEKVSQGLEKLFNNNGKKAVCAYWQSVRDMVTTGDFDIVGHLDVIRKRNEALCYFDESASWYKREIKETVKVIAKSGKIVEINTGGIARNALNDLYPSADLLSLLWKYDVPITLSSDAHRAQDIDCAYDRAREAAKKAGYSTFSFLTEGKWIQEPF